MEFSHKKIWNITYPVLISLLIQHLIGMTDTAFLGRVGEVELGASALASVYYLVIYMIAFGFSVGAEILMARRNGEKEYSKIGAIFIQGVLFLLMMAVVLFTISQVYSPAILRQLIESDQVYHATVSYMNWRVYGFFFSFIAIMFRAFYMATTNTKMLTINAIMMLLSNALISYLLIFGKLGLPQLGIAGAAIGSSIAELISVLYFIIYTRFKVNYKKYGIFNFTGISFSQLKSILNLSGWTMIQYLFAFGIWFYFFMAIEHLGERPLAITNMVRNISALLFLFINAFGFTGSALISNLIGAGKQDKVMGLCKRIIKMCTLTLLPLFIFSLLFPRLILGIYSDNGDLISSAIPSMYVMLSSYLLTVPGHILFLAVSATGNTRSALWIELTALSIYTVYIYFVATYLKADVAVCWTSEYAYQLPILIMALFYLKKANWRSKKI